jgi:hypothetical protein
MTAPARTSILGDYTRSQRERTVARSPVPLPNEARPVLTRGLRFTLRRLLVPLGLVPAVASLADCNLIIGAGAYHTVPQTCGAFAFTAPGCLACIDGACCAEAEACRASTLCAPLFDCLAGCGAHDAQCRIECKFAHQAKDPVTQAFASCRTQKCTAPCVGCGEADFADGPECDACLEANCCAEITACSTDPTCQREETLQVCFDPACAAEIFASPSFQAWVASPEVQATASCSTHSCPACGNPQFRWDCVRSYSFPSSVPGATATLSLRVYQFGSPNTLLAGVVVRACGGLDVGCADAPDAGAGQSTQSDGTVTLTVDDGFDGYFVLRRADLTTELFYPGRPQSGAQTQTVPMLTSTVYGAILASAGQGADSATVAAEVSDCYRGNAAGVSFAASSAGAVPFYVLDGANTPVTTLSETQSSGIGGLFGVTPGLVTLSATLASTGQPVSTYELIAHAGMLTLVYASPLTE